MKQQSKRYCHNRKQLSKADSIVNGAIEAHGGNYMTMPITPLCLEVRNIVSE
jgi:hypothetical protein